MSSTLVISRPLQEGEAVRHQGSVVIEQGGVPSGCTVWASGSVDILNGSIGEEADVIACNGDVLVHRGGVGRRAHVEADGEVRLEGGIDDSANVVARGGSVRALYSSRHARVVTPNGFLVTKIASDQAA